MTAMSDTLLELSLITKDFNFRVGIDTVEDTRNVNDLYVSESKGLREPLLQV